MNDVNLEDLKIRRDSSRSSSRKSFPLLVVCVAYALGLASGFGAFAYKPFKAFMKEKSLPVEGAAAAAPKEARKDEKPDRPGPGDFTEGGWIEVPSYHPIVVSSLVPGRLEELRVLEGARVKKGDVIALLYRKDFEDALDEAKAECDAAEADLKRLRAGFRVQEVAKARADAEAAEADVRLKEKIFRRTHDLVASGAASPEDLDRDEAALKTAQAVRDALRQELLLKEEGSRVEDIEAAEAEVRRRRALLELARNRYSYTTVTSPADGVVLERFVTPGTYIPSGNPRIVSLYDPKDLQVRVDVRQENIASVFVGQEVKVFTDAEPDRAYAGTVIRIEPMADFKKNTVQVKVKLRETSERLYPEMIARVRFKRRAHDGADGQGGKPDEGLSPRRRGDPPLEGR